MFKIDGCPDQFCRPIAPALDMFDLFKKGLPPISGGVLDQSCQFIKASRFFESEMAIAKAESNE